MSTELKSMHMGQITSFFIPNVTLVGEGCSKEIFPLASRTSAAPSP